MTKYYNSGEINEIVSRMVDFFEENGYCRVCGPYRETSGFEYESITWFNKIIEGKDKIYLSEIYTILKDWAKKEELHGSVGLFVNLSVDFISDWYSDDIEIKITFPRN